ncbi:S8 family peptidase [Pseudalkalibacillus berkeleyi]|uniref:S8 family peptidase n=1 Tax=Pseudalkalibacillus berkeleyi TaxID=1069813 RepID=A0ABS9H4D6_9BACL|nr:S8 family peptidase [Pseudalkalibacillus berkeleyi]MCF6138653.1 S8 family peptidase [Pseudalkalibacillus berkeleyi]
MNQTSDRINVCFKSNTSREEVNNILSSINFDRLTEIPQINVYVLKVNPNSIRGIVRRLEKVNEVDFVEVDGTMSTQLIPNDPLFNQQWGLLKINSTRAWNVTRGSSLLKIAVLDTGVNAGHPDLNEKIVINVNFSTSSTTQDLNGHGTHVAGIAAAVTRNNLGVAGLAINPKIMNIKVLDDTGIGFFSDIANGIINATANGAKVINMSFSGPTSSSTVQNAVQYAANNGVILVAAAGNDNSNNLHYPAAYSEVIGVAALNNDDTKASFSNYGASWVSVAAPGVDILSTLPITANSTGQTDYGNLSGTSQAAPFVSGLAALMASLEPDRAQVRAAIESTTVPITGAGTLYQNGRINAYAALLNITA